MNILEIEVPKKLEDLRIIDTYFISKVINIEDLSDYEKMLQLTAYFTNISVKDLRAYPASEIDTIAGGILPLITEIGSDAELGEVIRKVKIKGMSYGLIPNFSKMETGAYIDLSQLMKEADKNIHNIMAILYRPVLDEVFDLYTIQPYSTESQESVDSRAEFFKDEFPYDVVRSVVNFIKRSIPR